MDWCNCWSAAGVKAGAEQIIQVVLVKGACRWCLVDRWFQYQGLPICSAYFHAVFVVPWWCLRAVSVVIWAMLWWCSGIGVSAFLRVCCFGVFIMRKHGEEPSSCCVFFYLIFGTDRSRDDVQQIAVVCFSIWLLVQTGQEMMCSRMYVCCVFIYLIWYRPVERWCAADCMFLVVFTEHNYISRDVSLKLCTWIN